MGTRDAAIKILSTATNITCTKNCIRKVCNRWMTLKVSEMALFDGPYHFLLRDSTITMYINSTNKVTVTEPRIRNFVCTCTHLHLELLSKFQQDVWSPNVSLKFQWHRTLVPEESPWAILWRWLWDLAFMSFFYKTLVLWQIYGHRAIAYNALP